MLSTIINSITGIFGIGEEYVKGKNEQKLKKIEAKTKNQIMTLESKSEWELKAMASARYLRWLIAIHMLAALDFTIYLALSGDPDPNKIFVALETMPVYFQGFLATITGFAFGSQPLKEVGAKAAAALIKRKK